VGDNDAAFLGPWANYPLKTDSFLSVEVRGNEIIVITADFRAVYCKAKDRAQLVMHGPTATEDYELLARVWQAANDKARELGWIV
jgi:hypothetical protein